MILELFCLFLAAPASSELICELSDCSIPGARPAHKNCTELDFVKLDLVPIADQRLSSSGRGSLLDVAASVSDPNCLMFLTELAARKDPTQERSLQFSFFCNGKQLSLYVLQFEIVRTGRGHLRCIRNFVNVTSVQCLAMRNDRLRIRASQRGMEVENFNRNGEITARMEFRDRNGTLDRSRAQCNCEGFGKKAKQYKLCEYGNTISIKKLVAYIIAAVFALAILIVGVIFAWFKKDQGNN